ncbi:FAD/NAD(P)-binding domain-containing protein [Neurospora crassa]|uniref:FAD-binding domain-containing protein n=1 Tax=Neurospora crassa (strain ATCC 24698 / 74-OR23-1A / CBS 708.71 / DSM 1257 / FGSC 987) TaxID=367110 RepID=Q7RZ12_NEUCR|nr:hypothetical protein NCU07194 [Neurospora crassa OR74A]EAA28183.1 hypothetical protein NCU07194 [Neurospora crassa OR74A]KHE85775.1 FAD/NAD(P)-binding domain-containing protein [Neurospora crassa]|eukprot:XP_957419.1 hypothetical protein NCU07194 [Neurospora crassa OR74A]
MAATKDTNPSQPTIIIIGAGLTGLLAAQALKNAYFDEWAETLPMYNGETGDLMFKSAVPGARRITRRGLREVLSEGLDIAWGRKVTRLDTESDPEKVKVTLAGEEGVEEEEVWADYVLGTDGAGSKVREILFADQENGEEKAKAKRSGFMIGTCVVDYQDENVVRKVLEKHPVMAMAMSRGAVGGFGVQYTTGTPPSDLQHTFFWTKIWKGSLSITPDIPRKGPEAVRYLKQSWQGDLSPDFQSFVDATPEDDTHTQAFIDEMGTWIAQPFDNRDGRVTLAGDAGHPMLILRGQGFQHAVIDVQNYVQALLEIRDSGKDRKEVVAAYDKDMVERGSKAALQALEEAELAMDAKSVEKMLMVRKGHGRSV